MKEAFDLIKERLEEASFVDYDEHYTDNGECLVTISDALSIVSEVEAEYADKIDLLKTRIEAMKENVLPARNYVFGDLAVGNIETKNRTIDAVLQIISEFIKGV